MAEGRHHWKSRFEDRSGDDLCVERVHLLKAAAPARQDDHIRELLLIAPPQGPRHAHRGPGALHLDGIDHDAHVRVSLPDRFLQVVDDSTGGRGQDRDRPRQKREPAFALEPKRALCLESPLQVLELRAQLADIVELDLVDDEADGAVLRPVVDAPSEYENLAVLRQRRDAARVIRVHERVDEALAVADDEAVVALRALLHTADLALEQQRRKRSELTPDLVGELGDGVGALRLFRPKQ